MAESVQSSISHVRKMLKKTKRRVTKM